MMIGQNSSRDFPGIAMHKNPPARAGNAGSSAPGSMPYAVRQISPLATTAEPACCSY